MATSMLVQAAAWPHARRHAVSRTAAPSKYRETVSLEICEACGLRCDYWGGGANEVYEAMMQRNHLREQRERDGTRS
jgi:hypothetical protein